MITALIPNKNFNYIQSKKLYKKNQHLIEDDRSFEELMKTSFFLSFKDDNGYFGSIYFFPDANGNIYMNGFSKRKKHLQNIVCVKSALKIINKDVFSVAKHKTSAFILLKSGFKRINDNLFKHERT